MQKLTAFLEQYVQWMAVGLGAVAVLLMAYFYLVRPPVTVKVASKELTPGQIDAEIVKGPVRQIEDSLKKTSVPESLGKRIDVVTPIEEMARGSEVIAYDPRQRPPRGRVIKDPKDPEPPDPTVLVKVLPEDGAFPAPKVIAVKQGRTTVVVPDLKASRKSEDDTTGQARLVSKEEDVDWISVGFQVDPLQLAKVFEGPEFAELIKEQPDRLQTAFLRTELLRQEKLPNGAWSKPVVIKPLRNNDLLAYPGEDGSMRQKMMYLIAAEQNAGMIVQPPFYEYVAGTEWRPPGETVEAGTGTVAPVAPTPVPYPDPTARGNRRSRRGGTGAPGVPMPPGGVYPGAGMYPGRGGMPYPTGPAGHGATDAARMYQQQGRGGVRPPAGGMGAYGNVGRMPYPRGAYPGVGGRGAMPMPAPGAGAYGGFQGFGGSGGGGLFDPLELADQGQIIEIIAHDETVQPGKTYRYALRYYLKNPVFRQRDIAAANVLEQLALTSARSDWTKPVTITPRVVFYLANVSRDNAEFDVFTWNKGSYRRKKVRAEPGDVVGATGWSLADVRRKGNDSFVIVMDAGGKSTRRTLTDDRENPVYLKLMDDIEAAEATAAADAGPIGRRAGALRTRTR